LAGVSSAVRAAGSCSFGASKLLRNGVGVSASKKKDEVEDGTRINGHLSQPKKGARYDDP